MLWSKAIGAGGLIGPSGGLVGYATSATTNFEEPTVNLTALSGGLGSSAIQGDLLVLIQSYCGFDSSAGDMSFKTSGPYTLLVNQVMIGNSTYDSLLSVSYRFMTSTPDTSARAGFGYGSTGKILHARVYRGIDPTAPISASVQTVGGTNTSPVDPPSVTPSAGGFIVVSGGMACGENFSAASGFSSPDLTNFVTAVAHGQAYDVVCGYGDSITVTNPSALVGANIPASAQSSRGAVTFALKLA